jgi:N-acetyl-alpha-D-glucosaminyl L-malate synthase BshA
MKIGIVCYASVGGSGIVATELATSLALRGHEVHVLSSEIPFRLRDRSQRVVFHRVDTPAYPLFREPQYLLSLANRIVQVARAHALDVVHAHYAVPHAAAAYLARQILAAGGGTVPKTITTLHGTDITVVGSDPSYSETIAFCIDQSDGVTAVSESLKNDTYRSLPIRSPIAVIPNFLDCDRYSPRPDPVLRARLCPPDRYDGLLLHVSNFRPVKRLDAVMEIFRRVRRERRVKLLLVGDGPERGRAAQIAAEADLSEHLDILGEQDDVRGLLSVGDVFLLPSAQESFGLAAAEAMACGTPVVASRVGGLPEVITHGETGFLHAPDDLGAMAASALALLADPALRARIATAARQAIVTHFCEERIVPQYEALYARLTGLSPSPSPSASSLAGRRSGCDSDAERGSVVP